ncbi:hypothetical protein RRG08_002424 [Elysia crispata]|uniref:Uncharacterized protein n=1 Tax=Elysia crispata TaxID=231223 RepID=A0AAE0ZFP2_9GAST|nr:hypothetical protein RRG08_002424 [Elysia crispata]
MPVEGDKDGEFEKEGRRMSEVGAVSSTKGGLREKPLDDGNLTVTDFVAYHIDILSLGTLEGSSNLCGLKY